MLYKIEPLGITGANVHGRTSVESSGVSREGIKKDDLEETLRSLPSVDCFSLTAKLQIPLEASVLRNLKSEQEIVRLISEGKSIDLLRNINGKPGDIGVSCSPDGDEAPVNTLNVEFRDHDDVLTDRGVVWVFLGNPASIRLLIKAQALKIPGTVAKIVTEAEEALKTKVLNHF